MFKRGLAMAVTAVSLISLAFPQVVSANPVYTMVLEDGAIRPAQLSATSGEKVTIHVTNNGTRVHNLIIPDFYIFSNNLNPGENVTVSFTPDKTGQFPFYSDAGGKPESGMSGTLTVQ